MSDLNYSALLLIVDRSGSMWRIKQDMEEALDQLLRDQAAAPGMVTVDVVTFDQRFQRVEAFADPATVKIEIVPRGRTALHDAVGMSLLGFSRDLEALPEHARPAKVQVVVVSDGIDNASKEFSAEMVRQLVNERRATGWVVVFLGADQDAVAEAARIGVDPDSAMTFQAGSSGTKAASAATSRFLREAREQGKSRFSQAERAQSEGQSRV